jgi:hypothetical protein
LIIYQIREININMDSTSTKTINNLNDNLNEYWFYGGTDQNVTIDDMIIDATIEAKIGRELCQIVVLIEMTASKNSISNIMQTILFKKIK